MLGIFWNIYWQTEIVLFSFIFILLTFFIELKNSAITSLCLMIFFSFFLFLNIDFNWIGSSWDIGFSPNSNIIFLMIFSILFLILSIYFWQIFFSKQNEKMEFSTLIVFIFLIGLILIQIVDFLEAFLLIESLSFIAYILAGFEKNSKISSSSGIQYLIIGSVASIFLILSTILIYYQLSSTNFWNIESSQIFLIQNFIGSVVAFSSLSFRDFSHQNFVKKIFYKRILKIIFFFLSWSLIAFLLSSEKYSTYILFPIINLDHFWTFTSTENVSWINIFNVNNFINIISILLTLIFIFFIIHIFTATFFKLAIFVIFIIFPLQIFGTPTDVLHLMQTDIQYCGSGLSSLASMIENLNNIIETKFSISVELKQTFQNLNNNLSLLDLFYIKEDAILIENSEVDKNLHEIFKKHPFLTLVWMIFNLKFFFLMCLIIGLFIYGYSEAFPTGQEFLESSILFLQDIVWTQKFVIIFIAFMLYFFLQQTFKKILDNMTNYLYRKIDLKEQRIGIWALLIFSPFLAFDLNFNFLYSNIIIILVFLIGSFLYKVKGAPFHIWAPTIYTRMPTSSMVVLVTMYTLIFCIYFFQLFFLIFSLYESFFLQIFLWTGLFSLIFGFIGAFDQKWLKKFLVYSSVGHVGFLLFTFISHDFFNTSISLIMYLIIYIISSFLLWFLITFKNPKIDFLTNILLLIKNNGLFYFIFILIVFSMSGIPPLSGFFVKFDILTILFMMTEYLISFLTLLITVASFYYYLRLLKIGSFENFKNLNISFLSSENFWQYFKTIIMLLLTFFIMCYFLIIENSLFFTLSYWF
jgi:NADH:ubiquinone oxidoreductase subunit 2 (subunit N)